MTIAIDFDGTITKYKRYQGKGIFDPPIENAKEVINKLWHEGNTIIINTTRSETYKVKEYLIDHNIKFHYVNFNPDNHRFDMSPVKMIADVYIDDRGITFDGNWGEIYEKLKTFKPWWKE